MKTILVPTDGSKAAGKALDVALDLTLQHKAEITLLHALLSDKEPHELLRLPDLEGAGEDVVDALQKIGSAPEPEHTAAELMGDRIHPSRPVPEALLRRIGAHVLEQAQERASARGIAAATLDLADARSAEAIIAAAEATGADTIVMGTRGLRYIEATAFGSVSQEVCRTAPCTCIAVH